jgi:hypothetical protein
MIKLLNILKEIKEGEITIGKEDFNSFLLNTNAESKKINKINTYYGIKQNPKGSLTGNQVDDYFHSIKDREIMSDEEIRKIVLQTAPREIYIKYLIVLPSTSDLNMVLVSALKQKYKISDKDILTDITKINYFIDDMIDKEKYSQSDSTTQGMADTWIRSLKKRYGNDAPPMPIKKSKDKKTGHPGIQSGARKLLSPVYKVGDIGKIHNRIIVVDDFFIGGSSFREVYNQLLEKGISPDKILGYCLGMKTEKDKEKSTKQQPEDLPKNIRPIDIEIKGIEDEITGVERDPDYLYWLEKLKGNSKTSPGYVARIKPFDEKIKQLKDKLKDAQSRRLRII